jgi:hypothetical protein
MIIDYNILSQSEFGLLIISCRLDVPFIKSLSLLDLYSTLFSFYCYTLQICINKEKSQVVLSPLLIGRSQSQSTKEIIEKNQNKKYL